MNLKEIFEKYNEDFLRFEKIQDRSSNRPDLHAFILLDKLLPSTKPIIIAAKHKEYFLGIDVEALSKVINEEQIHELVCCGVMYDSTYDCLSIFT